MVNEILLETNKSEWGHVIGGENPADLGSHGMNATQIQGNKLWCEGPPWLKKGDSEWPKFNVLEDYDSANEERKKVTVLRVQSEPVQTISSVIEIGKYSSLLKLLMVTALVLRFINNIKRKRADEKVSTGNLEASDIIEAEKLWIVDAQLTHKSQQDFSKVKESLGILLQGQFLVCKGRLGNSDPLGS